MFLVHFCQKCKQMKLILIGYMGSGKSTIGKQLANSLNSSFIDLDDFISEKNQSPISDIFKNKGELFFRKQEFVCLQEILDNKDKLVLATGGGTPCYGVNMDAMLEKSDKVIYLDMSIPALVTRLEGEKMKRPLIANLENDKLPEFIGKHLFERRPVYRRASLRVLCDNKTVSEIVSEILTLIAPEV